MSETHPATPRALAVLRSVALALDQDDAQQAVRSFVRGMEHGIAPQRVDLLPWLVRYLGKRRTVNLIQALAWYPCYYCKGGLTECDYCAGRRRAGTARDICENCLDFAVARCEFCDGSGWITYNFIPQRLWLAVVLTRTQRAFREIKKLLAARLPRFESTNLNEVQHRLEQHLLALNRIAGVYENAVDAVAKRVKNDPRIRREAVKVIKQAVAVRKRLQRRMRATLRLLARLLETTVRRKHGDSRAVEILRGRAAFYRNMATSDDFVGTHLHHPFLNRVRIR